MTKCNLLLILTLIFSFTIKAQNAVVSGEMKKFHKLTLTWQGADFIEEATTFKNYRLNITFESPSGVTYVVPGYYAADGNAAESSAISGDKWRCHFNPLEIGEWSYSASFRTAENIAISFDPAAGSADTSIDGDNGTFTILETDKTGLDFRGKGKLEYVDEHYLQWTNEEYFLKFGTNSPEVLLEYIDFDNTPVNLTPRDYAAHISDWNIGDPTWQSDKGIGIIGAVNYLSNQGINSHYFMMDSSYGDTDSVFPWVSIDEHYIYDTSKLDQWQIVFDHMMSKGVQVHFALSEGENQSLFELFSDFEGDDPNFANARKIYFREVVARFGYLNAITWNIGEENGWDRPTETYGRAVTSEQQIAFASYLRDLTYYDDHITLHNGHANDDSVFINLIGDNEFTGASLQGVAWNTQRSRESVLNWRAESALAGRKWVVTYDEAYHSSLTGELLFRQNSLWPSLSAGAAGFEFYTPSQDWRIEDYTVYESYWANMRYAREFFANNDIPFQEMENKDDVVSTGWCFGKDDDIYMVYLPTQGTTAATITGAYSVKWYDPRNGGDLLDGSITEITTGSNVSVGTPPNNSDLDWVVLLQSIEELDIPVTGVAVNPNVVSLEVENTSQLIADLAPLEATNVLVSWTSSNTEIATVDLNGLVTAIAAGTAEITVTTEDGGFTAESLITVIEAPEATIPIAIIPVTGVSVNPSKTAIQKGEIIQLTAMIAPIDATEVAVFWTSSNTEVATVDADGLVTATSIGIASITVTTEDGGFTAVSEVTVTAIPVLVKGVTIAPSQISLQKGEIAQLIATVAPLNADDISVRWSSSDTDVVAVDEAGIITAVSVGIITINAITTDGNYRGSATVSVEDINTLSVVDVVIYPNPAQEMVSVKFTEANSAISLQLYDVNGRLVLNLDKAGFETQNDMLEFSILPLQNSMYFGQILKASQESIEFKLFVKK